MNEIEKRITKDPKGHKKTALRGYYAVIEKETTKIKSKLINNPKQNTI